MNDARAALVAVAALAACLGVRALPTVRPVALALAAFAGLDIARALGPPAPVDRVLFAVWPAPLAALAVHVFPARRGARSPWEPWRITAAFVVAAVVLAGVRELRPVASLPEAWRIALFASAYRLTRLAAVAIAVAHARTPRTYAEAVVAVLAWSAAWDLAGPYFGSPWARWDIARPLAGVTWIVVGAILVMWSTAKR